jgi:flagellar hook-length control protein FliK
MVAHEENNRQNAPLPVIAKDASSPESIAHPTQSFRSQPDPMGENTAAHLVTHQSETSVQRTQERREQQPAPSHPLTSTCDVFPKEDAAPPNAPVLPHSWDAFSSLEKQSDMQGSDRQDNHPDHSETPLPQGAPASILNAQTSGSPEAATFTVGNTIQAIARPPDTHAQPAVSQTPSIPSPHNISDSLPQLSSRSVVFEVAQPDLGRINVRVAMTNDLVHTHFSSDRSDMGHFLMTGQDRLQSALQASGLDMGQFRVDIDRQSAGRSFEHGQRQEQGRTWQQNPGGSDGDHRPAELHDGRGIRSHGMLNLVA